MNDLLKERDVAQGDLLETLYGVRSKPELQNPLFDDDGDDDPVCTGEFALHSHGLDQKVRGLRRHSSF
jgi:hypothetical protein